MDAAAATRTATRIFCCVSIPLGGAAAEFSFWEGGGNVAIDIKYTNILHHTSLLSTQIVISMADTERPEAEPKPGYEAQLT